MPVGVCIAIVAYVAWRAHSLAITIDEALTWSWHLPGSWHDIVLLRTPGEVDNNHVLFSMLAKLSVAVFGLSELSLRLPSLMGLACFLLGIQLVLRRLVPCWMQVTAVLALGLNPYLVDYFSIARGYGLALGLMTLGLASLLSAIRNEPATVDPPFARVSLFLFALAALANLAFLLPLLAAIVVLSAVVLLHRDERSRAAPWRAIWAFCWPSVPIIAYLIHPIVRIGRSGLFAHGGSDGFWIDTVGSLIDGTAYGSPFAVELHVLLLGWILLTLLLLPLVLATLWKSEDYGSFSAVAVLFAIPSLVALASVVQHYVLDVALLEGRRALFLIPLFTLGAVALFVALRASRPWPRAGIWIAAVLMPGLLCIHNLTAMNVQYVRDWKFDAASRATVEAAKIWVDDHPRPDPVKVRATRFLGPSANFYRAKLGLESALLPISLEDRPGFDGPADLYYVVPEHAALIDKYGVRLLRSSDVAETMLFERIGNRGD